MPRRISLAVLAAVTGALMAASAADAHRLPFNEAQKAANKHGKQVAQKTEGAKRYSVKRCKRYGDHKFTCALTVRGELTREETGETVAYVCRAKIIVRAHRTARSFTTRLRARKCQAV